MKYLEKRRERRGESRVINIIIKGWSAVMSRKMQKTRKMNKISKESYRKMKDVDGRGYRGRDAEQYVISKLEKKGWICFHNFSKGHDILAIKNERMVYIDVKEINQYVSSGSGKFEHGRIQVDKKEVQKWLEYPESYLIIKINRIDNSTQWKGVKAKKVWDLIKDSKSDTVKLSWSEIESIGEWKKDVLEVIA